MSNSDRKSFFGNFLIYLPFALLFGLIPYRFCGLLHLDYTSRLFVGLFFFLFFLYEMKELVTVFLNSVLVQLLFYYLLVFEDFIRTMKPFYQYVFVASFFFSLGGCPALTGDPLFWYIVIVFFFTFYRQMRDIFVNPLFEASSYLSLHVKKKEDLTWDLIVMNMSTICLTLFGQSVQNQLGKSMSQRPFNQISTRYVWGRVMGVAKTYPEVLTFVGSLAGGVGVVWGLHNQKIAEENAMLRHKEQIAVQREQISIQKIAEENAMLRHREQVALEREKLGKTKDVLYGGDSSVLDYVEKFFF